MPEFTDSLQTWLNGARDIALPCELPLADPEGSSLACEQALRVVPGQRWVCRAQWQGHTVLAKVFVADERLALHLQRECDGSAALQAAGIETPAVLAHGLSRCGRVGVVLHAWLDEAQTLSQAWSNTAQQAHWMRELGHAMAAMHRAGLCQHDIHRDNFLCAGERLWVIDAASVESRVAPLPEQASLQNVALLLAQWPLAEQAALRPLIDHYTAVRGLPVVPEMLAVRVQQAWRKRTQHFLEKTVRECTQFAVYQQRGIFAVWERDADNNDLQAFIDNPDAAMEHTERLKSGNSATVVRTRFGDKDVVIKRYNIKDKTRLLRRAFKRSRARNAWLSAWLLSYVGIDSPRPICLLEHSRFGMNTRAWLVTEAIDGEPLEARHLAAQPARMTAVPQIIRLLAMAGISHGDMKATNFMTHGDRLALIDLDAMRWHRSARSAARALRRDVDRFLRNWRDKTTIQRTFAEALKAWQ